MGEGVLFDGVAEVALDPSFACAISGKYQVFITPYAPVALYVSERKAGHFVVRLAGADAKAQRRKIAFAWRVLARRGDVKAKRFTPVRWTGGETAMPAPIELAQTLPHTASPPLQLPARTVTSLGDTIAAPGRGKPTTRK